MGFNLENYDPEKKIPLFGFGAKLGIRHKESHYIALNGDIGNPEVNGALGLLETYKTSVLRVILHGPTWFHQILENINDECEQFRLTEQNERNQKYWILMILTDGSILDK